MSGEDSFCPTEEPRLDLSAFVMRAGSISKVFAVCKTPSVCSRKATRMGSKEPEQTAFAMTDPRCCPQQFATNCTELAWLAAVIGPGATVSSLIRPPHGRSSFLILTQSGSSLGATYG